MVREEGDEPTKLAPRRKWTESLTGLIELCGRHPFATGLFALLGIFGLLFSFFTFGVDQLQNKEDNIETARIATSLARVEEQIAASAPIEEPADFDPIVSQAHEEAIDQDNLTFDAKFSGRTKVWIAENDPTSFANVPFLSISLRSAADEAFLQIAPYLILDVQSVTEIQAGLAALYEGERGGAESVRDFRADLLPQVGRQFAPLVNEADGSYRRDVDYFSLMPKETEEFFLNLNLQPGYVYTLRIGVPYRYKDRDGIHWVTPAFRTGVPAGDIQLSENGSDFRLASHPDAYPELAAEVEERSAQNLDVVGRSRVLKPRLFASLR